MEGFLSHMATRQRQAMQKYFRLNGALYLFAVDYFKAQKYISYDASCFAYIMPQEWSVDIDRPMDILIAETLLRAQRCHESPEGLR